MKWAFRNKTAEERLKMAIFKLLALSYMLTTLYISFFYSKKHYQVLCCVKIQKKGLNRQIWVWHISKY